MVILKMDVEELRALRMVLGYFTMPHRLYQYRFRLPQDDGELARRLTQAANQIQQVLENASSRRRCEMATAQGQRRQCGVDITSGRSCRNPAQKAFEYAPRGRAYPLRALVYACSGHYNAIVNDTGHWDGYAYIVTNSNPSTP